MDFFIKKFISQFLMPIQLVFLCYLTGWLLTRFSRSKWMGNFLIGCASVLFLLFGYGVGAERYIYHLERSYPSIELDAVGVEPLRGAAIVVLGQGIGEKSDLALRYQTGATFQMRLLEGMRLYRKIPEAQMYISLAGETNITNKERLLDDYAQEHDLKRIRLHLITSARDTSDEARLALEQVKTNRIVIVTSATHLPRAVKIFSKELTRRKVPYAVVPGGVVSDVGSELRLGYMLIPAPCDYLCTALSGPMKVQVWALPLPSVDGFRVTQYAYYEWLGNLYESLRD